MITRRGLLRSPWQALAVLCLAVSHDGAAQPRVSRPNIVWIVGDDLGPQLGAYGDTRAHTPTLDRLAARGVRFDHAFAVSPTCSPSRSALITGRYPTELGTQHHRSKLLQPPRTLLDELKAAGYTIAWPADPEAGKTDFNFAPPESTRASSVWPDAIPQEPFFAYLNDMVMHEGKLLLPERGHLELTSMLQAGERQAPESITPPSYYPDEPEVRRTFARYYELVTAFDHHVAAVLQRLEDAGVLERTVIIVLGDNGYAMPRAKRSPYEAGLHVPLIFAGPSLERGVSRTDLASLLDLAPTTLALAGLRPPRQMRGRVLVGAARAPEPAFVAATRDRVDENPDRIRAIRDARFLYLRNFMPDRPYAPVSPYADRHPVMQALRRAAASGRLDEAQRPFMARSKPREELYDVTRDPLQLHNLASVVEYRAVLKKMRKRLRKWMAREDTLGSIPERVLIERGMLGPPSSETVAPAFVDRH